MHHLEEEEKITEMKKFENNYFQYRMCYPKCPLRRNIRDERYNPCRIFVEPCFGIPLSEYERIKHFNDDSDF